MTSDDFLDACRAKMQVVLDLAEVDPTPDTLTDAPHLDLWHVVRDPNGYTVLMGRVTGHPIVRGPMIYTSPLLRIDIEAGWARTFSRFYSLGAPLSDAGPAAETAAIAAAAAIGYRQSRIDDLPKAMRRNRKRILARPWIDV